MLRSPRARQARPRLEALESRECPAVFPEGSTLHVWGTSGRDVVTIDQYDDTGFLTVTLNGDTSYFASSAITHLDVQLGNGRDDFIWRLLGSRYKYYKHADINLGDGRNLSIIDFDGGLLGADLDITVTGGAQTDWAYADFGRKQYGHLSYTADLRGGDDTATANLRGDLIFAYVQFTLNGGDGNDTLLSSNAYDESYDRFNSVDLDLLSTFGVVMDGGNGNDLLDLDYSGVMDGLLVLRLNGGANADDVFADVYAQGGSGGTVNARLLGSHGWDNLYLNLTEEPGSSIHILEALLDGGGGGLDFCDWSRTTSNVTVVNCL